MKLLMITGRGSAVDLAQGKRGAFYNTLEEFHKYWERIDIIIPKTIGPKSKGVTRLGVPRGAQVKTEHRGGEERQDPVVFKNVFVHPSPWPLVFHPFWILKKGQEIYKKEKFDLMTVHEYPPFYNGLGARMLWSRVKVPYVLEIFHIPGYPRAASLKERAYHSFFNSFIKYDSKKAKAVRVMNGQIAEKLAELGIPESKIKLIPAIYIDLDVFKPMGLEKKYDLIFVGRLAKNKGVNLLLEAVSRLKVKNPDFKLLIVGEGPLRKELEVRSKKLALEENVIFYGWAKDSKEIAFLLNQSKVLIMPSYNEGGPRVIIEAMACGLPILATPVGIVADIMKDGQFNQIFNQIIKWDSKDIAEKAESLLADTSRYQELTWAARELATRFEKKSAIRNYAERLKELSTV